MFKIVAADHIAFEEEHKKLLIAQVVLTDRVDKLAVSVQELRDEMRESQKYTDERLNALIGVVDGLVRRPPTTT